MPKSPVLQIPVDQETFDRVSGIAAFEGLSLAQVGRDLIRKALPAREKLSAKRRS